MSFRPGLLASTSRFVATPFHPAVAPAGFVRFASTTAKVKKQPQKGSFQAATEEAKKVSQQEAERSNSRMPVNMDTSTLYSDYVFESHIEPPFQYKWLLPAYWSTVIKLRLQRYATSGDSLYHALIHPSMQTGLIHGRVKQYMTVLKWKQAAAQYLPELPDLYNSFQRAQAEGDVAELKRIAVGPALAEGLGITRSLHGAQWSLVKTLTKPEFISVRYVAADQLLPSAVCQVVVRFHTIQSLTTLSRGKQNKRLVELKEAIVFQRSMTYTDKWQVKAKINPEAAKEEVEAAAKEKTK